MSDLINWGEGKLLDILKEEVIPEYDADEDEYDLDESSLLKWIFNRYLALLLQFDCIEEIIDEKVKSQVASIKQHMEESYKNDMDSLIQSRDAAIRGDKNLPPDRTVIGPEGVKVKFSSLLSKCGEGKSDEFKNLIEKVLSK